MADQIYQEKLQSLKTSLSFIILALIFSALFNWQVTVVGFPAFRIIYLVFTTRQPDQGMGIIGSRMVAK